MFVGGEFYYDDRWFLDTPVPFTEGTYFLNGGRACLTVICDYLHANNISHILLPSYLCPSILDVLEHSGVAYSFYRINEDFSVDLDDLRHKVDGFRAVYFINYFGFSHSPEVITFLTHLQKKGVVVVEDNAQAGFSDLMIGDFIFNSLRKFTPYDGGCLFTRHDVAAFLEKYQGLPNRRLPVIRQYRHQLGNYLFTGTGNREQLEEQFYLAEHYYDSDTVILGDSREKESIELLDWKGIKQIRRRNYLYLLSLIENIPSIRPIFPALQENNMPLGLPVCFSDVSRDLVNNELGEAGIGLSIHWDALLQDSRTNNNPLVVKMAGSILTLAIDQYTSHKQMDYLYLNLLNAIEKVTSSKP